MITAKNLTKQFATSDTRTRPKLLPRKYARETGGTLAVDDVSFNVEQGEIFVLMGLSGSGKSTLVRMINRLIDPTSGEVHYDGDDVAKMGAERLRELRNRKISMVFQHFALFSHRTIRDNVAYGLKARGVAKSERADQAEQALEQVGLGRRGDSYPEELSGGMQQRVGLARALATDPEVLIMDEPFSALDPLTRTAMQDQLLELQHRFRKTILFVTHDLNEAMRIGDRIMVMRDGTSVQLGTAAEIIAHPANDYVRDFISDVDRTRALTAGTVMRRPWLTAAIDDDAGSLLTRLEKTGASAVYVLDEDRSIAGVATSAALADSAAGRGRKLRQLLAADYDAVGDGTPLAECCQLTGRHPVPLAVVDDDNRLAGVVPNKEMLSAIASPKAVSHDA